MKDIAMLSVYNIMVITNVLTLTGIFILVEISAIGYSITKAIKYRYDDTVITKIINGYKWRLLLMIPVYIALTIYTVYLTKVS